MAIAAITSTDFMANVIMPILEYGRMPISRTAEFHRTADAIRNRTLPPGMQRPSTAKQWHDGPDRRLKSAFNQRAVDMLNEMTDVQSKLSRLSDSIADYIELKLNVLVMQGSSVFDDRTMQVSNLTSALRSDLARLNNAIASLHQFSRATTSNGLGSGRLAHEHAQNVVLMLQSSLAETSMQFKSLLEQRSKVSLLTCSRSDVE